MEIKVVLNENAKLPFYASEQAAGGDLFAANPEMIVVRAGSWHLIPTGVKMAIPDGYMLDIRPRSGLALKKGISVLNTPGTIDADYRGEIGVLLMNHSREEFPVCKGDRIAQAVLMKYEKPMFTVVDTLDETERGDGGFGHSGK